MLPTITILSDKTSWMIDYDQILLKELKNLGCTVSLIDSVSDLQGGDIAFFLSCSNIVKKSKLDLYKNNIVVHASALPHGRGWSPCTWQILEGKNEIPLSLFEAKEGVDSGEIYIQDKIVLSGYELVDEWREKLGNKIVEMCLNFVKHYPEIIKEARSQEGDSSFYPKRTPKDSKLDPQKTIQEQFNIFRVVDNERYPAFFEIDGKRYNLKIERCS